MHDLFKILTSKILFSERYPATPFNRMYITVVSIFYDINALSYSQNLIFIPIYPIIKGLGTNI